MMHIAEAIMLQEYIVAYFEEKASTVPDIANMYLQHAKNVLQMLINERDKK